jgi:hypothetical protein
VNLAARTRKFLKEQENASRRGFRAACRVVHPADCVPGMRGVF